MLPCELYEQERNERECGQLSSLSRIPGRQDNCQGEHEVESAMSHRAATEERGLWPVVRKRANDRTASATAAGAVQRTADASATSRWWTPCAAPALKKSWT